MHEPQIALQVQFASFDAEDGSDPRERGRSILRQERVLAALRDASADWADEEEAVVLIPVSDDGQVVTLDSDDRLAFDLTVERLRELFTAAGLTLWLQSPRDLDDEEELSDLDEELIAELEEEFERQADDDDEDETPDDLFAAEPVRVAEFSHRGPLAARLAAQMHDTEVAYRERGDWSMMTYRTGEAGSIVTDGGADGVVIVLNLPHAGAAWVEITDIDGETTWVWPNAERNTRPVLDVESIAVPEIADLYRRMLSEADGSLDGLAAVKLGTDVDLAAAYRACAPEAVGGLPGETARLRTFLTALGVPADLVEIALTDQADADALAAEAEDRSLRVFRANGWPALAKDVFVAGLGEALPLTKRDRPLARFTRALNRRPLWGAAISTAELTAGAAMARSRSRLVRVLGVFVIIDAVVDLAIWATRWRLRSRAAAPQDNR